MKPSLFYPLKFIGLTTHRHKKKGWSLDTHFIFLMCRIYIYVIHIYVYIHQLCMFKYVIDREDTKKVEKYAPNEKEGH